METFNGYVHIYTGNGKGKTTAAFGLAMRAAGSGMKVFIGQFIKKKKYNELKLIDLIDKNIIVKQYGRNCFLFNKPEKEDVLVAQNGFSDVLKIVKSGEFDLIILDEINIALYYQLITLDNMRDLIKQKPGHVELVLTGRYAPDELIELVDLVTEMKEIKHYYSSGVQARKGIEF